ncbi:MAG: hypothetical protein AAGG69_14575 [Pseudomonadota bacterium]
MWFSLAGAGLIILVGALALAAPKIRRKLKKKRWAHHEGNAALDYPVRTDWTRSGGKVNYSAFVYFDVDRDGRYGELDRTLSGIHVRLYKSNKFVRRSITNINGFANFASSTKQRRAPINKPSKMRFEVSVPPGWVCTSDNAVQSRDFRLIPGSPTGIGADSLPDPIGLAPRRYIRGTCGDDANLRLSFASTGPEFSEHALKPNTPFEIDVPDGADTLILANEFRDRRVSLPPYPVDLGCVSNAALSDQLRDLEVIDFEALSASGLKKVPNGYRGFDWTGLNMMSREFTPGCDGGSNGAITGQNICYTSSGHPGEIRGDVPFYFHSIALTSAWSQAEGETVIVQVFDGEKLCREDRITISTFTPVIYAPMEPSVTSIRIASEHYWQVIIDAVVVGRN